MRRSTRSTSQRRRSHRICPHQRQSALTPRRCNSSRRCSLFSSLAIRGSRHRHLQSCFRSPAPWIEFAARHRIYCDRRGTISPVLYEHIGNWSSRRRIHFEAILLFVVTARAPFACCHRRFLSNSTALSRSVVALDRSRLLGELNYIMCAHFDFA